jgi:hypothetical protein
LIYESGGDENASETFPVGVEEKKADQKDFFSGEIGER